MGPATAVIIGVGVGVLAWAGGANPPNAILVAGASFGRYGAAHPGRLQLSPRPLVVGRFGVDRTAASPPGAAVYHDADIVDPCFRQPRIRTGHGCPRCRTHSENAVMACTGQEIEHDDGSTQCSAGDACLGADELHTSSRSCRVFGPCPRDCQPAS